jgi:hypothetical protein
MATRQTSGKIAKGNAPLYNQGEEVKKVRAVVPVAAAWADADVVILAYNLSIDTLISRINLPNGSPGITGATDYDIGFHKAAGVDGQSLGAVLDKDVLVDGVDFSSARTSAIDILGLNIASFDKEATIGDLLGLTSETAPAGGVHLTMTLNTAGSAAGDIDLEIEMVKAQ